MTSDPTRLLDDPQMAASLRGDLAHAGAATVQGLDHGAGLVGLKAAIAGEAAAASGAAGAGLLGKIAIAVLLVGGGGAIVWATTRPNDVAVEPAVKSASVSSERPVTAKQAPAPQPELVPSPAVVAPEEEAEPAVDEPVPEEPTVRVQRPRSMKPGKPAAPADDADRVLREARMVADAREALAARPGTALSLVQQAAREFPRGQLIEEREAIAIRALAKLGRTEAARTRAERFLARYGSGPHAESVRRAIEVAAE